MLSCESAFCRLATGLRYICSHLVLTIFMIHTIANGQPVCHELSASFHPGNLPDPYLGRCPERACRNRKDYDDSSFLVIMV